MTRIYKKMVLSVMVCSIQGGSARGEGVAARWGGKLGARAGHRAALARPSRNSIDHYLQPKSLFTDIVSFRMLFTYILSLIYLPTLNIIFLSPRTIHTTWNCQPHIASNIMHHQNWCTQDKFSNYAIYFELAVLTHSHVFIMTRRYKKTSSYVKVVSMQ